MEQSPLTQQSRPETFEPKVAQLYRQLFRVRISYREEVYINTDRASRIVMMKINQRASGGNSSS